MNKGIFGYSCLGISISMACPLHCAHCITESGPDISKEMPTHEAVQYLRDAKGAIDHVSITGGEPFLDVRRLEVVVREAKALGYVVSVMTSGFWAGDSEETFKILRRVKAHGLNMIGVSLDRFHLEYIDEQRCVHIAEAADRLGLPVAVRVIVSPNDNYGDHVKSLLTHTQAKVHVNFLVRLGRAADFQEHFFKASRHPPRETCETVTAVDVVPGGEVYACCGPGQYMDRGNPLYLGNAQRETLHTILERGLQNPFMKVINTRGPRGLLMDLKENGHGTMVPIRESYPDACQLCLDICNNPLAVQTLRNIYADTGVHRQQNAAQFLKMAGEFMEGQEFKRDAIETQQ